MNPFEEMFQKAEASFWGHLGCRLEHLSQDKAVIALDIRDHHLNTMGILHGGVYASMLDSAMGLLAMHVKQHPHVVTTNLNIHYVAPIRTGQLRVSASVLYMSTKTITAQGIASGADESIYAVGTGSFRVLG